MVTLRQGGWQQWQVGKWRSVNDGAPQIGLHESSVSFENSAALSDGQYANRLRGCLLPEMLEHP
jgi:hypothetical protein